MTGKAVRLFPLAAFFLTGVGTALLGATLPAVLHAWQLSDGRGGGLLLAGWGGSTAGAFFARRNPLRGATAGLLLSAFALLLLSGRPPWIPALTYLAYGIGLGLTMTSISLLQSAGLSPVAAAPEMNRLNLLWALGACMAPPLALRSLHALSVHSVFRAMGLVFLLAALPGLAFVAQRPGKAGEANGSTAQAPRLPPAPFHFGLFAAASVGLESALGSWLTTYAGRNHSGVAVAVSANLAFWAGLLLSRAAHSLKGAALLHTRMARATHLAAAALGMILLLAHPTAAALPWDSLLCGLGLGPLYPFVLSASLPRFRSTAVFVLAGLGAALVPWLTGLLSTASGSLRIGLVVPLLMLLPLLGTHHLTEQHGFHTDLDLTPGA